MGTVSGCLSRKGQGDRSGFGRKVKKYEVPKFGKMRSRRKYHRDVFEVQDPNNEGAQGLGNYGNSNRRAIMYEQFYRNMEQQRTANVNGGGSAGAGTLGDGPTLRCHRDGVWVSDGNGRGVFVYNRAYLIRNGLLPQLLPGTLFYYKYHGKKPDKPDDWSGF